MLTKFITKNLKRRNIKKVSLVFDRCNSNYWSSQLVRKTFVDYFKSKDHVFVPSSSVIPKKQDGSYFVNSGMNQFKSIFTGTMESPVSHKGQVTNHQKCIRVGGKHNDLEDVGNDLHHHTFFEMLGNWSFNNTYSKYTACKMAWELLTQVYAIPKEHLYITYFHGNKPLNLPPDLECKQIWKSLGIAEDHLLSFGMEENFWTMGSSGPCGPCTEIHYCYPSTVLKSWPGAIGNMKEYGRLDERRGMMEYGRVDEKRGTEFNEGDCRRLVNAGGEKVKEVWNLVFMQYDMLSDKSIQPLPQQHIDTGMGLERLTAILQQTHSTYNTDLFTDLLSHISTFTTCPSYQGRLDSEVDRAYRIVADHTRMATVSISDGLLPGRKESAGKLRQIMYRCLHQLHTILKTPTSFMASLPPLVLHSLVDAYPDMNNHTHLIREVMMETEERYIEHMKVARKMMRKAAKKSSDGILSGEDLMGLQEGRFGKSVSLDVILLLHQDFKLQVDLQGYQRLLDKKKECNTANLPSPLNKHLDKHLDKQDVHMLKQFGISVTDDQFKYSPNNFFTTRITAIKALKENNFVHETNTGSYIVITDKTIFYGEGGGQESDDGVLWDGNDALLARVSHVKSTQGYVGHYVGDVEGKLHVGQTVTMQLNKDHREGVTRNHTATHLLHHSLHRVLGAVVQQGSTVKKDSFTFDFTSLKSNVTMDDLRHVCELMNAWVKSDYAVYRSVRRYSEVEDCKQICRLDEVYPSDVTVVSIGVPPNEIFESSSSSSSPSSTPSSPSTPLKCIELCAGTHVGSTGQLGRVVVTNFEGSIQGNKRITAVTASLADQAVENALKMKSLLHEVEASDDTQENIQRLKNIEKLTSSSMLLGKVDREAILDQLKQLQFRLSTSKNQLNMMKLFKVLSEEIQKHSKEHSCVIAIKINKLRSLARCLIDLEHPKPIFLLSQTPNPNLLGLCYVPQDYKHFSSASWSEEVCSRYDGQSSAPQGKLSIHKNISLFTLPVKNKNPFKLDDILKSAESYVVDNILKKELHS